MTRWPSVDVAPTPSGWARPANLMPAVGPSSWPRGRRAASEAEEILASAEAWWDVERSGFRDGDRYLRNIGRAGSVLDLRLGSASVANSNDPKWLGPEDLGYVYLPGVASNYLSAPDENALDITGDIDIRVQVALDDWTPAATTCLLSKPNAYTLNVNTSGTLGVYLYPGTAYTSRTSSVATGVTDGAVKWVRFTSDSSGVKFYLSDDAATWTQLGSTQSVVAGTVANTEILSIGNRSNVDNATGKFYRAQVLNGINGTTVLDINCDAITSGSAASFTATSGQTVTINRATSGRKSVAMPSKTKGGRPCMLLGTDDYLECQDSAQHGLLNFGGADSFTVLAVVRRPSGSGSYGPTLSKMNTAGNDTLGWQVRRSSGTTLDLFAYVGDGINKVASATYTSAAGISEANGFIVDRGANLVRFFGGGVILNGASTKAVGSLANTYPLRVGRSADSSFYMDMEFGAAAIWRRALTAREITVINNAATWGT